MVAFGPVSERESRLMTSARQIPASVAPPWQFTLMSLTGLGAAAIVWMLISSGIARHNDTRRHAALRTELERLDQAQSNAYANNGRFAASLSTASDGTGLGFTPTSGLQLDFEALSAEAWRATVRDTTLTSGRASCGIFRGPPEASPHRSVVIPGVIGCW